LGLDLWLKKGFLAWSATMLARNPLAEPYRHTPAQPGGPGLANALVLSISNILTEWSDKNVELN
jgi:hypothetical protein